MRILKPLKLVFLCLLLQACKQPVEWHATDITGVMPDLEFSLAGALGEQIDANMLHGKLVVLFFGFTNCPDACPTTLTQLSVIRKNLGVRADAIQFVLVSVDPERDTPEVMQRYSASFGPWLLGLTGTEAALKKLRAAYGVYAAMESSTSKGNYNVMHSTAVFVFDADGMARLLMTDIQATDAVVADLSNLIEHM